MLAGAGIAALIAAPNFWWQAANGFPMWELLEAGQHGKNVLVSPFVYLVQEVAITNFYLAPLWILGVVWLLRTGRFRFLGYTYLVLILEMIVLHGKHYYPADVYPIVIAAGGVALEGAIARAMRGASVLRGIAIAYAAIFAALFLPLFLPILGETQLADYEENVTQRLVPLPRGALATEHNVAPAIGSDYADMHGWPELAAAIRKTYFALPPTLRARTVVFATNYGDASALRFFAPDVPTISAHNQYWLWGYGNASGDALLEIGGSCWHSDHFYARDEPQLRYETALPVMEYENHITFHECTGLRVPMQRLWDVSKNYE